MAHVVSEASIAVFAFSIAKIDAFTMHDCGVSAPEMPGHISRDGFASRWILKRSLPRNCAQSLMCSIVNR